MDINNFIFGDLLYKDKTDFIYKAMFRRLTFGHNRYISIQSKIRLIYRSIIFGGIQTNAYLSLYMTRMEKRTAQKIRKENNAARILTSNNPKYQEVLLACIAEKAQLDQISELTGTKYIN